VEEEERARMANVLEPVAFNPGDRIIKQSENDDGRAMSAPALASFRV
jgi:hypothetical protein